MPTATATKPDATAAKPAAAETTTPTAKPVASKPVTKATSVGPKSAAKSSTAPQSSLVPQSAVAAASSSDYHIIVASVATEQDARRMAEQLVGQGYGEARMIVRDGKNRVSLRSYPTQAAAYHAVNQLREGEKFVGAWVLHCKVK